MKTKKWMKIFCVVLIVGMMAGTITGCQTNTAEKTSEENTNLTNNENIEGTGNQLQTVPMDAGLNLDLGIFTIFGKPLGDWTYEELCDYIYANYEEMEYFETMYDSYTGAQIRSFYDEFEIEKISISIIEEQSIQIVKENVIYTMNKSEWCRSLWSLTSYNPDSNDIVASICGQRVDTYLESVCPGLYEKLQEEPKISLKNGVAMMDSLNNGMERISLCVLGGNLELGYQDGVINSLTVIFTE